MVTSAAESAPVWEEAARAPAAVRRSGGGGGPTSGRVVRYRVALGTLEVDAGEQGPARIGTTGN